MYNTALPASVMSGFFLNDWNFTEALMRRSWTFRLSGWLVDGNTVDTKEQPGGETRNRLLALSINICWALPCYLINPGH